VAEVTRTATQYSLQANPEEMLLELKEAHKNGRELRNAALETRDPGEWLLYPSGEMSVRGLQFEPGCTFPAGGWRLPWIFGE
jgi:hypothetical protein